MADGRFARRDDAVGVALRRMHGAAVECACGAVSGGTTTPLQHACGEVVARPRTRYGALGVEPMESMDGLPVPAKSITKVARRFG